MYNTHNVIINRSVEFTLSRLKYSNRLYEFMPYGNYISPNLN